jgi:hypothetical protein
MSASSLYGPYWGPWARHVGGVPLEALIAVVVAFGAGILREVLNRTLLEYLARTRLRSKTKQQYEIMKSKFFESLFKVIHYTFSFAWECFILLPEQWMWNTTSMWVALPHSMSFSFYLFYAYQCGFYVYSLFATLFLDVRRNDWPYLILHHVVTMYLILYSWQWGFVRIGITILFLHDVSDIFLEAAKGFNYIAFGWVVNASFVLLVITFFVCRIVLFPYICIGTALFEAEDLIKAQGFKYYWWERPIFQGLLIILFLLQIYWFFALLRVLYNVLFKGKFRDDREKGPQGEGAADHDD